MPDFRMIAYELLNEPVFPMREQFGDMPFSELVESIQASGIQNPLLVRPVDGRFDIMGGHRRYKAAGVCALREVPCLVKDCSELEAVEIMVAENSGREDVTAAEEGRFYAQLQQRFNLDEPAVAKLVKKSEGYVSERLALVQCDADIAEAVLQKSLTFSAAKELLRVNPYTAALVLRCAVDTLPAERVEKIEQHRKFLLDLCVRCGATQRVAHSYVEQWKRSLIPENPYPATTDPAVQQSQTLTRMPRCLACGRDADPQNMVEVKIHYYEKDKVFSILREAGLTVYD
jgi:ParB/RepB/Spo0J family partition protein